MDQNIPVKGTNAYQDYVISLAKGPTLSEGVVNEPRLYYDKLQVPFSDDTVEIYGTPDVVYNRELFPVRLTHMTSAIGWDFAAGAIPTLVQGVGLQLRYHDQFYMNPRPTPIAAWSNKVVATPDIVSTAMSSWDFIASGARPPILAKQDTFQVDVRVDDPIAGFVTPEAPLDVTVSFTGFGALSRRPYLFTGVVQFTEVLVRKSISASFYRNDGNEPIIITDMTVLVGPQIADTDPATFLAGDIRRVSLNVRQVGSGTGSWWFAGPPNNSLCPAALLGLTSGRAVVHQFPGVGQLFNPGDGISIMMQMLNPLPSPDPADVPVDVGFVGYIMVT